MDRPLLMIPGPIEVSPKVRDAFAGPPPGHLAPPVIEAFGRSLELMREIWRADGDAQPFVVGGGGTVAMDMAAANLVGPGDRVLVVVTGYFSDRMAEMLRRQGAEVLTVAAPAGDAPSPDDVRRALAGGGIRALFATHVDTSTGVLVDPQPLARLAREHDALSVFDGVCATGAERFEMSEWEADVYLTGSQKAIGLPAGLALFVVGPRALAVRAARRAAAPPMYLDWEQWRPVMQAYEARRPSYFSTPPTNLLPALAAGLGEIADVGIDARVEAHRRAAGAMRAAWAELGLDCVPTRPELEAHTLSALRYPAGIDASLVGRVATHGVVVAGGLHPEIRDEYFRVGHMGYAITRPEMLEATVSAIAHGLADAGRATDPAAAIRALHDGLEATPAR